MYINDLGTKVEKWSGIASGTTYVTVDKLAYDSTNKKLGLKVNGADTVIPFSGELTVTTLWTNSNPNINFSQGAVTLNQSIDNFDYLKIEYKSNTSSSTSVSYIISVKDFKILYATANIPIGVLAVRDSTNNYPICRQFRYNGNTSSIFFVSAYPLDSNYTTALNNYAIPLTVYGLK